MRVDVGHAYAQLRGEVVSRHGEPAGGELDVVFALADRVHQGQRRKSGDPYITHPIEVASYVNSWSLPMSCVQAALVHDIPDSADLHDYGHILGPLVIAYVEALIALDDVPESPSQFEQHVLALKVADRLHNARTWQFVPRDKARLKAQETLALIAPVAASLRHLDVAAELRQLSRDVLAQPEPWRQTWPRPRTPRLFSTALHVLPTGLRERYREEWTADLAQLTTPRERRAMTLGLLWSAWTIRRNHH